MTETTPGRPESLSDLADTYQASGRYTFTREDARARLQTSPETLQKAATRLIAKRRLAMPRRGFYVVVPLEYRDAGAPPPSWFIDDLMRYWGLPYYVGLLSAAALHGAAHHQPQEFQIVTSKPLRPTTAGRSRLHFYGKRTARKTATVETKTETGSMRVSTPEATALDLVTHLDVSGHWGNVSTVLKELAAKLDPEQLAIAARREGDVRAAQRLGYALDQVGAGAILHPLADWVSDERPRFIGLRPDRSTRRSKKDVRWRVLVNETIESES